MYHRLFAKFLHAEMELVKERNDILEQLRDPKKDLLLELLENNVNSTRRLRALKECVLGRMARNELEPEERGCACGCDEEEDEDDCECEECEDECEDEDEEELTEEQREENRAASRNRIAHHKCLSALVDGDKEV